MSTTTKIPKIDMINIRIVPHATQRYDTCGDWYFNDIPLTGGGTLKALTITVSDMPDRRMCWPIILHEVVESLLCTARGITPAVVDSWDITGPGKELIEPGEDPRCPYFEEHFAATKLEEKFIELLKIDTHTYYDTIDGLGKTDDMEPK